MNRSFNVALYENKEEQRGKKGMYHNELSRDDDKTVSLSNEATGRIKTWRLERPQRNDNVAQRNDR